MWCFFLGGGVRCRVVGCETGAITKQLCAKQYVPNTSYKL